MKFVPFRTDVGTPYNLSPAPAPAIDGHSQPITTLVNQSSHLGPPYLRKSMVKRTSIALHALSPTQFSTLRRKSPQRFPRFFSVSSNSSPPPTATNGVVNFPQENLIAKSDVADENFKVEVGNPKVPSYVSPARLNSNDQAFFLLIFIACTASVAFTGFVIAAVPTLYAMGRAAISFSKLADTAREELPSTMAAIRLSGMEISDLTLELSDLSQEISEGVSKSAQAVQAAEAGVRQIGSMARHQTMSMIEERANLPIISIKPVVAGAAKKTSQAVGQATKTLISMISRGQVTLGDDAVDRLDV